MNAIILALFFGASGILHFYWALGGRWGFESVLPQRISGEFVIVPQKRDCVSVGALLFSCSLIYSTKMGLKLPVSDNLIAIGFYTIPMALTIRAIGDFRYMGLFKRFKKTDFARRDTLYFTPLCLILATLGFM